MTLHSNPQDIAGNLTICTLVFPRSDVVNVSLCFTVPIIVLACLLPMTLLVYHYQRIFQKILDTRSRWAVPCVAQVIRPAVNLLHRIITAALCYSRCFVIKCPCVTVGYF